LPDIQQQIIKDCIAGDRIAQARLYNMYAHKMLGVCMWYAKNKEEAEEVLHDGFIRVFTYLNKYKGEGILEGWIRKIMVNAALFKYRNKSSQLKPVLQLDSNSQNNSEAASFISNLDAKELVQLVQRLSPAYRMVFNLYVLEGMKHREIAALLGISEGTSKSNLADARAVLQKALTPKKQIVGL